MSQVRHWPFLCCLTGNMVWSFIYHILIWGKLSRLPSLCAYCSGGISWFCLLIVQNAARHLWLEHFIYESWLIDDKSSEFRRMHKAQCLHWLAFFPPYNFSIQIQRKFELSSDWLDNIRYALTEAIYKCLRSTACLSCPTFLRLSFFSHQSLSISQSLISLFLIPSF